MRDVEKIGFRKGLADLRRGLVLIRALFPWYLTTSAAAAVLQAFQPLVAIYFTARVLDALAGKDVQAILRYAVAVVGLGFGLTVLLSLLEWIQKKLGSTNWETLGQWMGERYATMAYEYVEDSQVNDLLADLLAKQNASDLGLLRLYSRFPRLIEQICGLTASAVMLAGMFRAASPEGGGVLASPWVLPLLIASMFLPLFLRVALMKCSTGIMERVFDLMAKMNTRFMYYYNYIRTEGAGKDIRLYGQQNLILSLLGQGRYRWVETMSRMVSESAAVTAAANSLVSGLTYLLIGLRALEGAYSIGEVAKYVGAIIVLSRNMTGLISTATILWENIPYLRKLYQYLDLTDPKYRGTLTTEKRADSDYELEFRNVSFRYPGSDQYALKNVNLKLNVGRRLAVVGMNGSGKTTLIMLLCRLYDPTEGVITLNGVDIRKYDYEEYLGIFSVVFQDFTLTDLSLGQNVAARVEYDPERVRQSLEAAGLSERLATLSQGLDTALNKGFEEDGVMISGGEAQKIALARALYKGAPFVILDEPTAALDPLAEYEIYSKFDSLVGDKTAVYISHRLSSCRFCHDIAVFHEGELIQRGSHEALVADKKGKYHERWTAQAQYYAQTDPRGEAVRPGLVGG